MVGWLREVEGGWLLGGWGVGGLGVWGLVGGWWFVRVCGLWSAVLWRREKGEGSVKEEEERCGRRHSILRATVWTVSG